MATRSAHRAGSLPDDPASAGRRLRDHPGTPRPALRAPGRRPGPIQPSPRRPGPSGQDSLAAIGLTARTGSRNFRLAGRTLARSWPGPELAAANRPYDLAA